MKKPICGVLRHTVAASALMACFAGAANAEDWLLSVQNDACSPEAKEAVAGSVRNAIEEHVRRAELALKAPTPLGDLSCLSDLMTAQLDVFSNVGGLIDTLSSGMSSSVDLSSMGIDVDVSGMVCQVAAEKWGTLTEALDVTSIASVGAMAASAVDRATGSLSDAYDTAVSSVSSSDSLSASLSGTSTTTDSSGYAGEISSYVVPDSSYVDTNPVLPATYIDTSGIDTSAGTNGAAWDEYTRRMLIAWSSYNACLTAGGLDGTTVSASNGWNGNGSYGVWNVPGDISNCSFNLTGYPSYLLSSSEADVSEVTVTSEPYSATSDTANRTGGQSREVQASDETQSTTVEQKPIWELVAE